MTNMLRSRWWSWGFRSAVMLYFVLLIVFPILGIYGQSFSDGWASFVDNLTEPLAWKAVMLTVKLAIIATIVNMAIGTMAGWVLTRYRFPGRKLLNSMVDLPFALPTAVVGLMILLLLGPRSAVGQWADSLGFTILFHEPAIVVAMVFVTFPFVIRAVQPLLEEIDASEEEAAYTMGATKAKTFFRIILPNMLPGILSGAMLAFSRALAEFGAVVLVAGNIPGRTQVASVYIFGQIESDHPAAAAAVSVLLLTFSFLILWLVNYVQTRRTAR
ncbi:sulfate transport system permease protein [Cohnella thailandensis]|uniref:Molybdenum transport system permease n=2 Tax=Cohnella thailandensis TaxID=557557 RepID=A0A841SRN7_9BACL|nr:sulfate ABC transporter permease subunit CysT [Cohnella thailandensis]MBP1974608.1 sulfate transport system permease protein [Cohnella thailandensis]